MNNHFVNGGGDGELNGSNDQIKGHKKMLKKRKRIIDDDDDDDDDDEIEKYLKLMRSRVTTKMNQILKMTATMWMILWMMMKK